MPEFGSYFAKRRGRRCARELDVSLVDDGLFVGVRVRLRVGVIGYAPAVFDPHGRFNKDG
jgi:hypothetical protein